MRTHSNVMQEKKKTSIIASGKQITFKKNLKQWKTKEFIPQPMVNKLIGMILIVVFVSYTTIMLELCAWDVNSIVNHRTTIN